jgi:hypothetical protein
MLGAELALLGGYAFEVRYSDGSLERARASAELAADAYEYFCRLLPGVTPDLAIIVANRVDWESRQPYGLPYFNDDPGQLRPGIVVMSADSGDFWVGMGDELHEFSPEEYPRLLEAYPDGRGGLDLQPFFDLVTIHELGHAFEVLGELRLPTFWLGEIFANVALHTFVASRRPELLGTLEVLALVGATSPALDDYVRATGYTTLEDLELHYTGGDEPMSPLNYVWYQYRWQRLAAAMFNADGEGALIRFWDAFRSRADEATSLTEFLSAQVSETLGAAIREWR